MTKTQFREALERLGLTQGQAAEALGLTIRTINGYANGEPIPATVARLLAMYLRYGLPKRPAAD